MTDTTVKEETLNEVPIDLFAEQVPEPKTVTIEDVIIEGPKRKPGRPRKNVTVSDAGVDEDAPSPKPTRRRSKKLSGADVAQGVEMLTTVVVMLSEGEQAHWYISAKEFAPLADGYADLLNRIPSQYVKGAFDLGGYLTLAIGTYALLAPKIAKSQEIARNKKRAKQEAMEPDNIVQFDAAYSGPDI